MSGPGWGLMQGAPPSPPGLLGGDNLTRALLSYQNQGQDQFTAPPGSTPSTMANSPMSQVPPQNVQGMQATAQAMPQVPPQHVPFLARLFGGLDPSAGGLLNTGQQSGLGHQGLLNAGLTLLAMSRGQRNGEAAPGIGQAIAAGLQSGRESYSQGGQTALAQQQEAVRRQVFGTTNGQPNIDVNDPASLRRAAQQLMLVRDEAGAKMLNEAAKAKEEADLGRWTVVKDEDGNPIYRLDSRTGETAPLPPSSGAGAAHGVPSHLLSPFLATDGEARKAVDPYLRATQGYRGITEAFRQAGSGRTDPSLDSWHTLKDQVRTLVAATPQSIQTQTPGAMQAITSAFDIANPTAADVARLKAVADAIHAANTEGYNTTLNSVRSSWNTGTGRPGDEILKGYSLLPDVPGAAIPTTGGTRVDRLRRGLR